MVGPKEARIRIITVDDHPVLREGVTSLLRRQGDMEVVGEAETGAAAIEAIEALKPDVTLIDLKLPDMSGIKVMTLVQERGPGSKFLVLTTSSRDMEVVRALKVGAAGYLLKTSVRKELLGAVRAIHAGRKYLSAEIAYKIALHASDELLSEREIDILTQVACGRPFTDLGSLRRSDARRRRHDLRAVSRRQADGVRRRSNALGRGDPPRARPRSGVAAARATAAGWFRPTGRPRRLGRS